MQIDSLIAFVFEKVLSIEDGLCSFVAILRSSLNMDGCHKSNINIIGVIGLGNELRIDKYSNSRHVCYSRINPIPLISFPVTGLFSLSPG